MQRINAIDPQAATSTAKTKESRMHHIPNITDTTVWTGTIDVDGLSIFYREAGKPGNPKLVLLHGFPASSHQYRNLIPALADKFHVIATDYPGFGNSDMPDPTRFSYTFDKTSEVVEGFLNKKGFTRFGLFVQDYGGPVGFRILVRVTRSGWNGSSSRTPTPMRRASRRPGTVSATRCGRTDARDGKPAHGLPGSGCHRSVYLHGHKKPELISPDNWNMDFRFMERPQARRVQMDFFYDYRTNVTLYPQWQAFLRSRQPKTIIFWGQDDIFFTREGGEAYSEGFAPGRDASARFGSLRG